MKANGKQVKQDVVSAANELGINMNVTGVPSMPYFRIESNDPKIHTNWVDACLSKGIYLTSYHNHFLSTVHGEEEINVFINKAKEAFEEISS